MEPLTPARLGVVLVNWRGAADTIECLEGLLRSTIPLRAVVVDNASGDGSLETIEAWARGETQPPPVAGPLGRLTIPPLPKPVALTRLTAAESLLASQPAALTLIDSGGNLGFAGGNNVGLRHLLLDPAIDYVWLLNNDTVPEPDAAAALVERMDATPQVGMCGTVVRYYHRPDTIQALGGSSFDMLTGQSRHIGNGQPAGTPVDSTRVVEQTAMVLGASLAVSRPFLDAIGLMEERYFLYYEEIDWAMRNNGRFRTAFADTAIVYHKEGGSIGSSGTAGARSTTSEYYLLRSRLQFVRRHRRHLLPVHYALAVTQIGRRLLRGQPKKALAMTRALLGLAY
jgi:GT2 family glycosyltransferase